MKKIVFFIAIACLAMATGCNWNGDTGNTGATTLYTDDYQQTVEVPVSCGETILADVGGTGVNVVATADCVE